MIKSQYGRVEITGTKAEIRAEFAGICECVYRDICKGDNKEFMYLVDTAKKVAMLSKEEKKNVTVEMLREIIDMIKGDKNDEED